VLTLKNHDRGHDTEADRVEGMLKKPMKLNYQ